MTLAPGLPRPSPTVSESEFVLFRRILKRAVRDFNAEQWGCDDQTAVDAFVKILKKRIEEEETK